MMNRSQKTSRRPTRSEKGGMGRWGDGVIKIFWSIELNDLWSKKIFRPKMIAWSGATSILRWSCLQWSYCWSFHIYLSFIRQRLQDLECSGFSWLQRLEKHFYQVWYKICLLCDKFVYFWTPMIYWPIIFPSFAVFDLWSIKVCLRPQVIFIV